MLLFFSIDALSLWQLSGYLWGWSGGGMNEWQSGSGA